MNLCDYFSMTRIVNLPERRDRRREIVKELAANDMQPGSGGVEFFNAIRPEDAAGFPSQGVRGCFLSHLEILKEAAALDVEAALMVEDDLAISPMLPKVLDEVIATLRAEEWGIVYLGYTDSDKIHMETDKKLVGYTAPVGCTHFYAVHKRIIPRLIAFLEQVQSREPGDPNGGPMHYDGALTTFRAQNPDVLTLLAYPCLGFQRSSRSDIYKRWYERIPILRQASDSARIIRTWFRSEMSRGNTI